MLSRLVFPWKHLSLGEVLPNFDRERVYTSDIKKLYSWYNLLIGAGITDFSDQEEEA